MGKKIVIAALLLLIFTAALTEYFYVEGAAERLTEALKQVQIALEAGDAAAAQAASQNFSDQWDNEKQRLEALYEHEEVDVISATAERVETYCRAGDRVNALAEVSSGMFYINHLREMIGIRWENIL